MAYGEITGTLGPSAFTHGRFAIGGRLHEQDENGSVDWWKVYREIRAGMELHLLECDRWIRGVVKFADELGGYHLELPERAVPLERLATEGSTLRLVYR
jgi:hypothetical protein